MREIECGFHDRIISKDLWPAHSPNMIPLRFLSLGYIEKCCLQDNPRILEKLKQVCLDFLKIKHLKVF